MSGPAFVALVAIIWLAIGLTLSLVMGRRGHDRFTWLVLGTLLGPFAFALAVDSGLHGESLAPEVVRNPRGGHAGVDVLAGIDGSTQSRHAVRYAATLLGPRIGRLTLATVVPFDAQSGAIATATETLERAAKFVPGYLDLAPKLEVLHGHPASALQTLARQEGYDLLVIGTRGAGMSKRLLGSAAGELSHATHVPVLIVDRDPAAANETAREPMSAHEAANEIAVSAWAQSARST